MKKRIMIELLMIPALIATVAMASPDDFFVRDPEATYDEKFPESDVVIAIPGYKLNTESEIARPIEKDHEYAKSINREIMEKADRYIYYRKINRFTGVHTRYNLSAAKELGGYILLYFSEPEIIDGDFELIYSKKLSKIIGTFIWIMRG